MKNTQEALEFAQVVLEDPDKEKNIRREATYLQGEFNVRDNFINGLLTLQGKTALRIQLYRECLAEVDRLRKLYKV